MGQCCGRIKRIQWKGFGWDTPTNWLGYTNPTYEMNFQGFAWDIPSNFIGKIHCNFPRMKRKNQLGFTNQFIGGFQWMVTKVNFSKPTPKQVWD
jgi:hypothetical protein